MLILSKVLWIACLVAQSAVLARLIAAGLVRRGFPFFSAYLTWGILSGLVLVWVPFSSASYGHAWLICEPLFVVLGFASVWECYRRAVAPYQPGDRYFVLAIAGTMALTLSIFSLSVELHALSRVNAYYTVILFDRLESSGTALFLGGLWLVFRQFPIARSSNTSLHWRLLLLYGLQNTVVFMIDALSSGRLVNLGNVVGLTCSLVLYVLWALGLSEAGEIEPDHPSIGPVDEDRFEPERHSMAKPRSSLRVSESLKPGASEQS